MQSYGPNGDDSYEGDQPLPQDEVSTAQTEQLYSDYEDEVPPLPPRSAPPRPYRPQTYGRSPSGPEVVYDTEPEPPRSPGNTVTFTVAKFNQFLQWLLWVIEVMFALRFFLTFFSTSNSNAFISLLTSITDPLLAPFKTALRVQDTGVEWYILLAMLVYFLVILALIRLLRLFVTEPEL
ncbi:MAG TPA: YggT family protein [Ktedonobacterales bacterium]|nr:YggT family protein [Ktedonobacterales bacterium]